MALNGYIKYISIYNLVMGWSRTFPNFSWILHLPHLRSPELLLTARHCFQDVITSVTLRVRPRSIKVKSCDLLVVCIFLSTIMHSYDGAGVNGRKKWIVSVVFQKNSGFFCRSYLNEWGFKGTLAHPSHSSWYVDRLGLCIWNLVSCLLSHLLPKHGQIRGYWLASWWFWKKLEKAWIPAPHHW